jgi:hypothetical protein
LIVHFDMVFLPVEPFFPWGTSPSILKLRTLRFL